MLSSSPSYTNSIKFSLISFADLLYLLLIVEGLSSHSNVGRFGAGSVTKEIEIGATSEAPFASFFI
jgi:hypothetical protein